MRFVVQRVMSANVVVEGDKIGEIGKGFRVCLGVVDSDTKEIADKLVKKLIGLRILRMKMERQIYHWRMWRASCYWFRNLHYMQTAKGNRPSFIRAGKPEMAEAMYEYIIEECGKQIKMCRQANLGQI